MKRFFVFLCIVIVFIGCKNKEQSDTSAVDSGFVGQTLGVPLPTAEILAALGPENDIPLQRLLSDPILVTVGKPKRFLDAPISSGNEWYVANTIVEGLQLYNIDPNRIERVVQSTGIPMEMIVNVPNPQNPMGMPQPRRIPIMRRATVITFNTAVEKPLLFAWILRLEFDPEPAFIESLKRTEGKNEYYDLTDPNLGIPQRAALGLIDERTVVIIEGVENDIKAVFSDTTPKNAILDRLKRTPVDTNDLTLLTSLEGINMSPEMLENMLASFSEKGYLPFSFIQAITQHLRALTVSLNASAEVGQPIVSVYAEGRNAESAEIIGETIGGVIINSQTMLITMSEDAKQMLPIPSDFAFSLLNAMSVDVKDTRINVVLNNFETLIPTINEGIHDKQTILQQHILTERRAEQAEQLWELGRICAAYHSQHGKFPADILDTEGKPLLSWRVALLPTMGLEELYNKFKLDEPWDSETNREWMKTMPVIFLPLASDVAAPKTVIRFFDSPGTPFSNRDLKLEDLKVPLETLMFIIVSSKYAEEWTKPASLEFNIDNIADIVEDLFLGVTFEGRIYQLPILPATDPQYEEWKRNIEALVLGKPLPTREPEEEQQLKEVP